MLPAPTTENLLATAGVSRGGRPQSQPRTPTAPGVHQTRPKAPQQLAPPPSRAPLLVPVRVVRSWPGKTKMPGIGPHPVDLDADTGKTYP